MPRFEPINERRKSFAVSLLRDPSLRPVIKALKYILARTPPRFVLFSLFPFLLLLFANHRILRDEGHSSLLSSSVYFHTRVFRNLSITERQILRNAIYLESTVTFSYDPPSHLTQMTSPCDAARSFATRTFLTRSLIQDNKSLTTRAYQACANRVNLTRLTED